MSHFTVLVIGEDVEGQLAPFDENTEVEPYVIHSKSGAAAELAAKVAEYYDHVNGEHKDHYNQEYCKEQLERYQKMTPEEFWKEQTEDEENVKDDCIMSTYNPKSKWDWWTVGGRWAGFFLPKAGAEGEVGTPGAFGNKPEEGHFDSMLKKDIDFEGMRKEEKSKREKWWDEAQEKIKAGDKHAAWLANIEEGDTRESYINRGEDGIMSHAVVKDGEWYEQSKMGWWGMKSEAEISDKEWAEQYVKLIDSLPDDTLLTIVDCHI